MVWWLVSGEMNLLCYVGRHEERYFQLIKILWFKDGKIQRGAVDTGHTQMA